MLIFENYTLFCKKNEGHLKSWQRALKKGNSTKFRFKNNNIFVKNLEKVFVYFIKNPVLLGRMVIFKVRRFRFEKN